MTRYFYHAESGCAWPQQDDAPAPDDGLSMEIDAAQYERICKAEANARYDAMSAEDWAEYNAEHPPMTCPTPGLHGSLCRCGKNPQCPRDAELCAPSGDGRCVACGRVASISATSNSVTQ